mmetsp:Transcript_21591/g.52856  ORF Transcript_21591/g.52856 Transcript_21591/m.52856 type:complete len:158 (-) Transcript_21591:289-762(-)
MHMHYSIPSFSYQSYKSVLRYCEMGCALIVFMMLYAAEGRQELAEAHYLMVICVCCLSFCGMAFVADMYNIQIQYPDLWPLSEFALEVTFMTLSFFAAITLASACRWTYNDDESYCQHFLQSSTKGNASALFGILLSIAMFGSVQETYRRVRKYQFS